MARRALVLGGGGITGIAWEIGVLAGLRERGVDLTSADLIVGTSAGSVVGTQIATGLDLEERYAAQLEDASAETAAALGRGTLVRLALAAAGGLGKGRPTRRRIGALALRSSVVPEEERVEVIGRRLPVQEWPERALRITAVDAHTGEFVVFDKTSGVPLVRAVASSCAVPGVWPPVTIGDRRFMDGGMRSATNADVAAGADRVVVLAPIVRGLGPMPGAAAQAAALRRAGTTVTVVGPDSDAVAAIGRNVLDPAHRAGSARAGRAQAASVLDAVRTVWA